MSLEILEDINDIPEGLNVSDNLNLKKINVAKVKTKGHQGYIFLDDTDNKVMETKSPDTRFEFIIPYNYKKQNRSVYYITGKAGKGKTLILGEIMRQYQKLFKNNKIYYICSTPVADDQTLSEINNIIELDPTKFYKDELTVDEEREIFKSFSNSLLAFDDIDSAPLKDRQIYTRFKNKSIEIGRKYNISVAIISHVDTSGHASKMILKEIDMYFCFRDNITANRLLTHYNNYKPDDLEKIKTKSWICFNFKYNCIVTPRMVTTKKPSELISENELHDYTQINYKNKRK